MKKISAILAIVLATSLFSSAAFALSYEEEEALMNNYIKNLPKQSKCEGMSVKASKTYAMKESGMSNNSICYALKNDLKIGQKECDMLIGIAGEVKQYEGSVSEQKAKDILFKECMR